MEKLHINYHHPELPELPTQLGPEPNLKGGLGSPYRVLLELRQPVSENTDVGGQEECSSPLSSRPELHDSLIP